MTDWNEGIQGDYDPTLSSRRGFALSQEQLPSHIETGFGKGLVATAVDFANYKYSTGNLAVIEVKGNKHNRTYQIHRHTDNYYGYHDPEDTNSTRDPGWFNTLTLDSTAGHGYDWAFAPMVLVENEDYRGYAINGLVMTHSADDFAWTVWVR